MSTYLPCGLFTLSRSSMQRPERWGCVGMPGHCGVERLHQPYPTEGVCYRRRRLDCLPVLGARSATHSWSSAPGVLVRRHLRDGVFAQWACQLARRSSSGEARPAGRTFAAASPWGRWGFAGQAVLGAVVLVADKRRGISFLACPNRRRSRGGCHARRVGAEMSDGKLRRSRQPLDNAPALTFPAASVGSLTCDAASRASRPGPGHGGSV